MAKLQEYVGEMAKSLPKGFAISAAGEGEYRLVHGDDVVAFDNREDEGCFACYAVVGGLENVAEKYKILEDALEANFLWQGTEGASLSLSPEQDKLEMWDRRDMGDFENGGALLEFLMAFVRKVQSWRLYIERHGEEGVRDAAAPEEGGIQ